MTDILTDEDLKAETVKEPATRWRNWWRALTPKYSCRYCGMPELEEGAIYVTCCKSWPSKDSAETAAAEQLADDLALDESLDEYLGALPDGERP